MADGKVLLVKTCKILFAVLLINLCSSNFQVCAYSTGAPNYACRRMVPCHGFNSNENSPYTIEVSPKDITKGSKINVTLKANSGKFFIGFIGAAFKTSDQNPIGKMNALKDAQVICHGKGVTHKDSQPKTQLTFTWNPPDYMSNSDKVVFKVTILREYNVYWREQPSEELSVSFFPGNSPAASETAVDKASAPRTDLQVMSKKQFWS